MQAEVVVISDDESDQEIHLVACKPILSHAQPALAPPRYTHFPNHKRANRLLTMMGSAAIVIDSDSEDGIDCDSEDGIETDDDDDDDGENQDILGLLSQMADHSGLRAPTRTQSTSVLETCRARTERGSSRTFAGSILSQAGPPLRLVSMAER